MTEADFASLAELVSTMDGVQLSRFTPEFLSYLAAADLSVSMAGYNTCMNILATGVSSLVWPFGQNREQRLRAEKLAALGALTVLEQEDLEPSRLAASMKRALDAGRHRSSTSVNLNGAEGAVRWLEERYG
jgi:predicted glycosyltransferase